MGVLRHHRACLLVVGWQTRGGVGGVEGEVAHLVLMTWQKGPSSPACRREVAQRMDGVEAWLLSLS